MISFAPCRWTLLASLICTPAFAETVVPLQGQTQQQIQQDIAKGRAANQQVDSDSCAM